MKISLVEKITIIGSFSFCGIFTLYNTFKPTPNSQQLIVAQRIKDMRENILNYPKGKMMYSVLTLLYLLKFDQTSYQDYQSFYVMYDALQTNKFSHIALNISQEEFDSKYQEVLRHPKFNQAMNQLDYCLSEKKDLKEIDNVQIKNLEKLYLINNCQKNKNCELIFAKKDINIQTYKNLEKVKEQDPLYKPLNDQQFDQMINQIKNKFFIEEIVNQITQKKWFSFMGSKYKIVFAILDQDMDLEFSSQYWKQLFIEKYNHEIKDSQSN